MVQGLRNLEGMGNQALGSGIFGKVHLYSNIGRRTITQLQITVERKLCSISFLLLIPMGSRSTM